MAGLSETRRNPYPGPRAFEEQEQDLFFGRDEEVEILVGLVMARRASLLFAPSGAGKSSLLRAGLIPELARQEIIGRGPRARSQPKMHVLPILTVGRAFPGSVSQPITNVFVFSAVLTLLPDADPDSLVDLALTDALASFFPAPAPADASMPRFVDGPSSTLLIFDQFEELFTHYPTHRQERESFFRQVSQALHVYPALHVLFSMREDYIAELTPYAILLPDQLRPRFRLEFLGEEAARLAIQQPACQEGVEFSPAAITRLVDDLRRVRVQRLDGTMEEQMGARVEPVQLQVVCRRLWEKRPADTAQIAEADIEAAGDVDSALSGYYAERVAAIAGETGTGERAVRDWFDRHLITEQGIRGQVLQGPEKSQGLDNRAIWPLVDAHLVRAEKRRGATWFELAHDRLIEPVRVDNAAWRRARLSPLQRQAALWEDHGRTDDFLLRGQALIDAETWVHVHDDELTPVERDFLRECRQARVIAEREKRQARRIRWLAVGATVLALIAIILAVIAWIQTEAAVAEADARATEVVVRETAQARAEDQERLALAREAEAQDARTEAERQARMALSRQLAAQAISSVERKLGIDLSLLLAVEAIRATQDAGLPEVLEADDALRRVLAVAPQAILRHGQPVRGVAFNREGNRLATLGGPHQARLWDVTSGEELALLSHGNWVYAATFSPDGTQLATCSADGTAHLWDVATGQGLAVLHHQAEVRNVAFSPDGTRLVTSSQDNTALLWDAAAGGRELAILQHAGPVGPAAFSPDGRLLVTGSEDGTARLWDVSEQPGTGSGVEELAMLQHEGAVLSVAVSPDGNQVATASADGTARLWDPGTGRELAVLRHKGEVQEVIFGPDGARLVTHSTDGIVRLWDVSRALRTRGWGQALATLHHRDRIWAVACSPDGARLATASADTTAYLVDTATGEELAVLRHDGPVRCVTFSPDGSWLASASQDGTARLWDAVTGRQLAVRRHENFVRDVAFSSDGTRLATASNDGTARLWYTTSGVEPKSLRHQDEVFEIPFSPDGKLLATGSQDGTTGLWDVATGEHLALLRHEGPAPYAVFSPGGTRLATGSDDGTARLWDTASGEELAVLNHDKPVLEIAFSPNGVHLATACEDGTAYLWDASRGEQLAVLTHDGPVRYVAFSPDGAWLASSSADGTARLWDVAAALQPGQMIVEPAATLHPGPVTATVLVNSVAFSPNGRWLAAAGDDGTARLWDLVSREEVAILHHEGLVWRAAFSPDGAIVATYSKDNTARLWDLSTVIDTGGTGGQLAILRHDGPVMEVDFSPDGAWLATASDDGTARLWDVATGQEVIILRHERSVWRVAFSPDGTRLATSSEDGIARLWRLDVTELVALACDLANRNLSQKEWQQFLAGESYHETCPHLSQGE